MKRLLLALALSLLPSLASAQCSGVFPNNTFCGNTTGSPNTPRAITLPATSITSAQLDALLGSTKGMVAIRNATVWIGFANGTGALTNDGAGNLSWVAAGSGTVTSVSITAGTGITQSGSPVTTAGAITVNIDKASVANFEAGASNKVLTSDIVFTAETTTTYGTTTTLDFNTFLNTRVTLTGNITTLTCSNMKAAQSGTITLVQDGTGSRTMVAGWCSVFRWANGARGVLSTAASSIDALFYNCISSSVCYVSLAKAQAN